MGTDWSDFDNYCYMGDAENHTPARCMGDWIKIKTIDHS